MFRFLIRFAFAVAGFWLAEKFVPGIAVDGLKSMLIAALLLGLANAIIRPILVVVTFPIVFLTLGLFLLVINAATLGLVAMVMDGLTVNGFWPGVFGALVIGACSWVGDKVAGEAGVRD